ncbi:MAG: PIN domain-containing protein [Actinobacteria bacterium]|nr:PIN domain-containing protein [Actinomycetota bacterium]
MGRGFGETALKFGFGRSVTRFLVDTSLWVSYLRESDPQIANRMEGALADATLMTAEPIVMELLAGAAAHQVGALEYLLDGVPGLPIDPSVDFRSAAAIYRSARSSGRTIRSQVDCLIAVIAMQATDVVLIHNDLDYEIIASVAPLRQERWAR